MIIPMYKYTFLVFHKEYKSFLKELQNIGVLHVIEKDKNLTSEIQQEHSLLVQLEKAIEFLEQFEPVGEKRKKESDPIEILDRITRKQEELEELKLSLEEARSERNKALPWGNFSTELIGKLKQNGIHILFLEASLSKYEEIQELEYPVQLISDQGKMTHFILLHKEGEYPNLDLKELIPPTRTHFEIEKEIKNIERSINGMETWFCKMAYTSLSFLKSFKKELLSLWKFDNVVLNTSVEADEKLMILEGWVPKPQKEKIDNFLQIEQIAFFTSKPTPHDNVPVLLKNNRFSRLFEPIGSMFSLPDYSELDLTVFFAPFFMMFFGFCLGDAGYGLLFIIGAGIYKFKAKKEYKPYLSLIQFLGLATVIFGTISGTLFGINLINAEIDWLAKYKNFFLNPDGMFNLALILGGVQIVFGLFIRIANQTKQFGFIYALATCGWLIIILGSIFYVLLTNSGIIAANKTILYVILAAGAFFILFLSDPKINIFSRIGKGIWDIYSTITGIFGDLLSYIRLFALGLSSAILGFVINDIGIQILDSSKILGPLFFAIFLIFGHTLNILISSLGSFVHPMRLTFVEFYKSAQFKGGGEKYKPFSK